MSERNDATAPDRGGCVALIYALVAERLAIHYEHGQWLNQSQGATLAADLRLKGAASHCFLQGS